MEFSPYMLLILVGTFISSISQVLLKKAAMRQYDSRIKEYLNARVIIAYLIFFGATMLSVIAYRVVDLSLGVVLEATGYVYVMIFGVTIFKETLNLKKIIALIMIIVGIVIYAL